MINRLIILGGHIQALGLARQAWQKGIAVELITNDKCSVARWSRVVRNTYICCDHKEKLETGIIFFGS